MKKVLTTITASILAAAMSVTSFAAGWQQGDAGWKYATDNAGTQWYTNGWQWIDGNGDGTAECYYFDSNGYMLTDTVTPDGYTVNADGQWIESGVVKTQSVAGNTENHTSGTVSTSATKGTTFPDLELKVNDYLIWRNYEGGTEYKLYYMGSEAAAPGLNGYSLAWYGQEQCWNIPDSGWVTPHGVTVNYRLQVMENGKVKTATAEELGLAYEGGTIRDVPYDSNAPLKRVVDKFAINIEGITRENFTNEENINAGQLDHYRYLISETQIIAPLSGQPDIFQDYSQWRDWELSEREEILAVLRNWLNSFDFENATEMEKAEKIRELLQQATYDISYNQSAVRENHTDIGRILVQKRGVCQDFASTAQLLATLMGLKISFVFGPDHTAYIIQVDGIPHYGENGGLHLDQDWREESGLGTKHYNAGLYIPYIDYR